MEEERDTRMQMLGKNTDERCQRIRYWIVSEVAFMISLSARMELTGFINIL